MSAAPERSPGDLMTEIGQAVLETSTCMKEVLKSQSNDERAMWLERLRFACQYELARRHALHKLLHPEVAHVVG